MNINFREGFEKRASDDVIVPTAIGAGLGGLAMHGYHHGMFPGTEPNKRLFPDPTKAPSVVKNVQKGAKNVQKAVKPSIAALVAKKNSIAKETANVVGKIGKAARKLKIK